MYIIFGIMAKIVVIILVTVTFIGVKYIDYRTTYAVQNEDNSLELNHNADGEFIGNYSYTKSGKKIRFTFLNYEKYSLENVDYEMGYGIAMHKYNTHGKGNYFIYFVDYLLMMIAAFVINRNSNY